MKQTIYCDQGDDQSHTTNDFGTHCDWNFGRDDDKDCTIKHLNNDI